MYFVYIMLWHCIFDINKSTEDGKLCMIFFTANASDSGVSSMIKEQLEHYQCSDTFCHLDSFPPRSLCPESI